jgi:hypothetical protein
LYSAILDILQSGSLSIGLHPPWTQTVKKSSYVTMEQGYVQLSDEYILFEVFVIKTLYFPVCKVWICRIQLPCSHISVNGWTTYYTIITESWGYRNKGEGTILILECFYALPSSMQAFICYKIVQKYNFLVVFLGSDGR